MSEKLPYRSFQNKASPVAEHRRQMIWQVWTPLGASLLVVLALAVLAVVGAFNQSTQIERWGNISAIWVIIPVLLAGIIFIVVVFACVYGVSRLLIHLPGWMLRLQLGLIHISQVLRKIVDSSTQPVMAVNSFQTRVKTLWKLIFGGR